MKTEPTKACKMIEESWYAIPYMGVDYEQNPDIVIDKEDVYEIAKNAFQEGQSSPKIKQLKWEEYENLRGRKSYFAKTPFTPYEVADGGDHFTMFSPDKRFRFKSADEAKAAAQRDFERRIKDCLA